MKCYINLVDRWASGLEDDPKGRKIINKGTGKTLKELMEDDEKERKKQEKAEDEKKWGF